MNHQTFGADFSLTKVIVKQHPIVTATTDGEVVYGYPYLVAVVIKDTAPSPFGPVIGIDWGDSYKGANYPFTIPQSYYTRDGYLVVFFGHCYAAPGKHKIEINAFESGVPNSIDFVFTLSVPPPPKKGKSHVKRWVLKKSEAPASSASTDKF